MEYQKISMMNKMSKATYEKDVEYKTNLDSPSVRHVFGVLLVSFGATFLVDAAAPVAAALAAAVAG